MLLDLAPLPYPHFYGKPSINAIGSGIKGEVFVCIIRVIGIIGGGIPSHRCVPICVVGIVVKIIEFRKFIG
jgi:hypothetical protein